MQDTIKKKEKTFPPPARSTSHSDVGRQADPLKAEDIRR